DHAIEDAGDHAAVEAADLQIRRTREEAVADADVFPPRPPLDSDVSLAAQGPAGEESRRDLAAGGAARRSGRLRRGAPGYRGRRAEFPLPRYAQPAHLGGHAA